MKIAQVSKASKPAIQKGHKFQQEYVPSPWCCGRCLFNIPPGTILWLLPSMMLLLFGVVLIVIDKDGSWREGTLQSGIIFGILGGTMSFVTVLYCIVQWKRLEPEGAKFMQRLPVHTSMQETVGGVQLMGVYRITGEDNRAFISSQDNVSYSYRPSLQNVEEEIVAANGSSATRVV